MEDQKKDDQKRTIVANAGPLHFPVLHFPASDIRDYWSCIFSALTKMHGPGTARCQKGASEFLLLIIIEPDKCCRHITLQHSAIRIQWHSAIQTKSIHK